MYGTGNKKNKLLRITFILVQIVNVIFVVAFQRQYKVNVRFYYHRLRCHNLAFFITNHHHHGIIVHCLTEKYSLSLTVYDLS